MTKNNDRGRPPIHADMGKRLMLRNDRGVRYDGILEGMTRGGMAIILCFGTDYGGDWRTLRKPEHATVTGAEVLDDA